MSERQPAGDGWIRSINWTSLFTLMLGVVLGTVWAVAIGEADPGGDYLKVYLAFVTVLAAAGLGLTTARLMDQLTDRRRVRRKANAAWLRINRVAHSLDQLLAQFRFIVEHGGALQAPEHAVVEAVFLVTMTQELAQSPPDFDELLDSKDDRIAARGVSIGFHFCRRRLSLSDDVSPTDIPTQRAYLDRFLRWDPALDVMQHTLDNLQDFEARLAERT